MFNADLQEFRIVAYFSKDDHNSFEYVFIVHKFKWIEKWVNKCLYYINNGIPVTSGLNLASLNIYVSRMMPSPT